MKILAIETSCDETAIAILDIRGSKNKQTVTILGNALHSQVKLHEKYGGVYPMMAKREHTLTLTPLLEKVLGQAKLFQTTKIKSYEVKNLSKIKKTLEREGNLSIDLLKLLEKNKVPKLDCIAVTNGPGLEPALFVGINFAKALSLAWNIPVIPINHMEGHLLSSLAKDKSKGLKVKLEIEKPNFPLLALLISGGHTELVLMKKWGKYEILGVTRDDAVGEAFDKVARMLELPYPGGPQISRLAEEARQNRQNRLIEKSLYPLPRPMIHSHDLDFSFAGLKTAVLYTLKKIPDINQEVKKEISLEFENAVTDVFIAKTKKALLKTKAKTFIIGGGVSANKNIREKFTELMKKDFPKIKFLIPTQSLTTDNAVMIGLVAHQKFNKRKKYSKSFTANGNLSL